MSSYNLMKLKLITFTHIKDTGRYVGVTMEKLRFAATLCSSHSFSSVQTRIYLFIYLILTVPHSSFHHLSSSNSLRWLIPPQIRMGIFFSYDYYL